METTGILQSCGDDRLIFTAAYAFPAAGAVSLEYDDVLFIGEVVACGREGDDWRVLLQVRHRLNGLESLLNLRHQLLGVSSALVSDPMCGIKPGLAA